MLQDERELKLVKMEERMWEVELALRNVKMLLQNKVTQLKEQVTTYTKTHRRALFQNTVKAI